MPRLSLAVGLEPFDNKPVATEAHERGQNGVCTLRDQEKQPCFCGGETNDFVEIDYEVREPNCGAQIVEDACVQCSMTFAASTECEL